MQLPSKNNLAASIRTMMRMQHELNSGIHFDWIHSGNDYDRAVWVECAELMDHFGWKWWAKQEPDVDQVKMEMVDIWHFGLSSMMVHRSHTHTMVDWDLAAIDWAGSVVNTALHPSDLRHMNFRDTVTAMVHECSDKEPPTPGGFVLGTFVAAMMKLPMDWDELHRGYIGKNALNAFRQDNGYKEGTYVKDWNGVEDNVYLDSVLTDLGDAVYDKDISERLPQILATEYARVRGQAQGRNENGGFSYRKKPVVIEAFQMTPKRRESNADWPNWMHEAWQLDRGETGALQTSLGELSDGKDPLEIVTLEGVMAVGWGDYIIRGISGELYPCKPDIFDATYEAA